MEVVEFNLFAQSCTIQSYLLRIILFAERPPLAIYFVVHDSRGYGFHCHFCYILLVKYVHIYTLYLLYGTLSWIILFSFSSTHTHTKIYIIAFILQLEPNLLVVTLKMKLRYFKRKKRTEPKW